MLEEISIKDLGVIQSATLSFTKGLTVITGETGAGKTMVLSALGLLLGKRSDSSIIRHGTDFTSVEGCWNVEGLNALPAIQDVGAVIEDNLLYINRTVQKDGRSRAVVGGKTTPASVLSTIGESLVNIHGQSDQLRLKSPAAQREALDSYAGAELSQKIVEYRTVFEEWKTLTARVKDVKTNMVARRRQFDEYSTVVAEIEKVKPLPDEDEQLKNEASILSNVEALEAAAQEASNRLTPEDYETPDTLDTIAAVIKLLSSVAEYDAAITELLETATIAQSNLNDLSAGLASYLGGVDSNALEHLNEVQERRAALNNLIRKYGMNLQDVLDYWEEAAKQIVELDPDNSNLEILELQLTKALKTLEVAASSITKIRTKRSKDLQTAANKELAGLAMGGTELEINIMPSAVFASYGKDEIAFMLKSPGSPDALPIGKFASGGELSRVMLSILLAASGAGEAPTVFMDELDSGVGGSTGYEIGKRIARLAQNMQVIVITHLPQVAVFADNHLNISKTSTEDFVSSDIKQLTQEERVEELSRMFSGLTGSISGKAHAEELIASADKDKASF